MPNPLVTTGSLLACRDLSKDSGLWFVFHADDEGILAVDLTVPHDGLSYKTFASVLDGVDTKPPAEQIVLRGGPLQSDDALVILHTTIPDSPDSHLLNEDFSFRSYRYVALPGKPPSITTKDNAPTRLSFSQTADFLVIAGFRLWETKDLHAELQEKVWTVTPATPDILFRTSYQTRLSRALNLIN